MDLLLSTCNEISTSHRFVAAALVHAITVMCVSSHLHAQPANCYSLPFGSDALRFDILCFVDSEIPHDLLFFLFATANSLLKRIITVLSFLSTFPSFLLEALVEWIHICRTTFLLHCVLNGFRTSSFCQTVSIGKMTRRSRSTFAKQ